MNTLKQTPAKRVMDTNIRYITLHSTQTKREQLPENCEFNYLITSNGEIMRLLKIRPEDGCISVAYIGGIGPNNRPANTMNHRQQETLYGLLIQLSARYKNAQITGANQLYGNKRDTGFDVKKWLAEYTPAFAAAA
jgi:hypothetical protein